MRQIKNVGLSFLIVAEWLFLLALGANYWVIYQTHGRTYNKISRVPPHSTALILGTSPKMRSGKANPYFIKRMNAAATLYRYGKVKTLIVSGEKSPNYNEPEAMKNYLIKMDGLPEWRIVEDPKGFSTRASIYRLKNVYGKNQVIIVSQGYHNLRALFYARNLGIDAIAYEARDVYTKESYYRNHAREFLARVQAVIYYLLGID